MSGEIWLTPKEFKHVNKDECLVWICHDNDHVELVKYHPPHFINGSIIYELLIKRVAHIVVPQAPKEGITQCTSSTTTQVS